MRKRTRKELLEAIDDLDRWIRVDWKIRNGGLSPGWNSYAHRRLRTLVTSARSVRRELRHLTMEGGTLPFSKGDNEHLSRRDEANLREWVLMFAGNGIVGRVCHRLLNELDLTREELTEVRAEVEKLKASAPRDFRHRATLED